MMCNQSCPDCGSCLVPGMTDDADAECPRCGSTFGGA